MFGLVNLAGAAMPALAVPVGAVADHFLSGFSMDVKSTFGLTFLTGIAIFAVVLAILHIRERKA